MDCEICSSNVEKTFLSKLVGSFVKVNGKKRVVCSSCQSTLRSKEEIVKKL